MTTTTGIQFVCLPTIAETLEAYIAHERRRGLMPLGIDAYLRDLADVRRFFGEDVTTADLTPASIATYYDHLLERELAASTITKRLSALRAYCRWCIRAGLRADDPTLSVVYPKLPDYLPRPVSSEQLAALIAVCQTRPGPELSPKLRTNWSRQVLVIATFLYTGARLAEAARLTFGDIDFGRSWVIIREGKGGRSRIVPLHPALRRILLELPAERRRPECSVLAQQSGKPLRPKSLAHTFDFWLPKYAGIEITAHQMRHTFATLMREAGYDLDTIGELLGHRDPKTTRIYAKLPDRARREAVASLPDVIASG